MEPWEVMISESQERMVAIVAPERLDEVEAVIDRWELHRAVIGEITDTGLLRALWDGDEVGAIPARLLTEECPRYAVEREPRLAPVEAPTRVPAAPRRAARAARVAAAPLARVRDAALRPARPVSDGAAPGARCGRPPPAPRVARARADARRPGQARRARPARRRAARRPRGGAERRLRRWRAARAHGLPQLRQPGEAGGRLGARGDDRGHGPRVRGARRADRLGERLALQRHARPLDPPDPRRGLRRPRPRRPPRPARLARGRRDPPRPRALAAHARRVGGAGALGLARRHADPRSRLGGGARPLRDARGPACLARPRRRRGRPRRRARRGGALERRRRGARARRGSADALRRGRRPGDRALCPREQVEPDPTGGGVEVQADRDGGRGRTLLGLPLADLARAYEGTGA